MRYGGAELTLVECDAVELAHLDGFTDAEVADLLVVPLGDAVTAIHTGLGKLQTVQVLLGQPSSEPCVASVAPSPHLRMIPAQFAEGL